MHVRIQLPTPLRPYAGDLSVVDVEAQTVGEALEQLIRHHGALRNHLYSQDGKLRNFVNVYVGDQDIRSRQKEQTKLTEGANLLIVPAIAGGFGSSSGSKGGSSALSGLRRKPADPGPALSNDEIKRYSRHLIMPEVGMAGQRKLKAGKVLCIGAGGLGSPLALYLAAAGVGKIGIVDFDVVDFSNLQRQVLHGTSTVGKPKLESAKIRLKDLNPEIEVVTHETRLSSENALDLFKDYDVVADGTDNFPTRYLVNDACVLLKKPNVYGSIFRFDGQASVFWAEKGPCYRCLYPEPPPPGLVPSCAEGGVLGVLPGVIGTIQATEVVKILLGKGEPLVGRLLLYDALAMTFREVKLRKDPNCPLCGTNPTITKLIDYDQFCGIGRGEEAADVSSEELDMSVEQVKAKLDRKESFTIVDVREPTEWDIVHLGGTNVLHIPMKQVPERLGQLSTAEDIVVHCHHGGRSAEITKFLRGVGYKRVWNMAGGIDAWAEQIEPDLPRY